MYEFYYNYLPVYSEGQGHELQHWPTETKTFVVVKASERVSKLCRIVDVLCDSFFTYSVFKLLFLVCVCIKALVY